MFNLSDKDLDRLSREAAEEHDPGDIVGPKSWDKLEMKLDRHLGHVTPRPVRAFYRLPFYYAPVVLLILGASYYFIRNHKTQKEASSGSPPLTFVKPSPAGTDRPSSSSQNPTQTDKSTSTLVLPPATVDQPSAPTGRKGQGHELTSGVAAASSGSATTDASGIRSLTPTTGSAHNRFIRHHQTTGHNRPITSSAGSPAAASDRAIPALPDHNAAAKGSRIPDATSVTAVIPTARQLSLSSVRGPVPTKHSGPVSDSALRAFTAKATPTPIRKKGGMQVNRSLQIGVLFAPDFSSVSSQSGDKPGSTVGLTVDYQFAHHWYIGSGLLLSRKNYAAAPQNYHVPKNYYSDNRMTNVDFIKGSFNMLEVPLNLRYDFSVTGNTLFFATAGLSSYLLTSENCNYYYHYNVQPLSKNMHYDNEPDYLFSALDLSVGVEMGINNSLSVLVAPYVKMPVRNIGFGQVQLSSVGINFVLEFTPVLSRKR